MDKRMQIARTGIIVAATTFFLSALLLGCTVLALKGTAHIVLPVEVDTDIFHIMCIAVAGWIMAIFTFHRATEAFYTLPALIRQEVYMANR